ncbi:ECF RNA polymerase sigma factor SigJ [Streptomyces sp. YIM 130001]|uniref:sigma factor-like helix-turn-helix DNA-binding protein n=1 Tax=Streptomyces sp. YIM 130001 TaxID=2259644 RepID=UPI000E654F11|nr:sigma factor-like helix-turn-helix DNA-binding protein [Streptomyces sp. YIM 130001]RII13465.1 ECF RNA polymerase sigma factor SigJ [Streptomyces sp. YIM 130001]
MTRIEEFEESKPLLYELAHRILGSASGAEQAVRDTWLRYRTVSAEPVSGSAFLPAAVTQIAKEQLRTARTDSGAGIGPWLAEPLLDLRDESPDRAPDLEESLSTASLLMLERLSPLERAVLVLRDLFGCDWPAVAAAVGCSESACRQLVGAVESRGGAGPGPGRPRRTAGADQVDRLLAVIVPALARIGITFAPRDVDRGPGAVFRDRDGRVLGAAAFDIVDGRVQTLRWVDHPETVDGGPVPAAR